MQQSKQKRKKSQFLDFEKHKRRKNVRRLKYQRPLNQFLSCKCTVTIKLLRPYFNQQFYIILHVIVCCFRAHIVSQRFDRLPSETLITFSAFLTYHFQENVKNAFCKFGKKLNISILEHYVNLQSMSVSGQYKSSRRWSNKGLHIKVVMQAYKSSIDQIA